MYTSHLPNGIGVSFKPEHFQMLMDDLAPAEFIEIHAENYLGAGGLPHAQLTALRQCLALSIHGVGLSLGGIDGIDRAHLQRVAALCARYQPDQFSEHLAWSSFAGQSFPDLLPVIYSRAHLQRVVEHVDEVQQALKRPILIENPALYVQWQNDEMAETEFLRELAQRSGCGLLLDINNVVVSCHNLGRDPARYMSDFPLQYVQQVHVAGHRRQATAAGSLLIDDHGATVSADVKNLLAWLTWQCGALPVVLEWDRDIPTWAVLTGELEKLRTLQQMTLIKRSEAHRRHRRSADRVGVPCHD